MRHSINTLVDIAVGLGFQESTCVHEASNNHTTYDWPRPLVDGQSGPFLRLHIAYIEREGRYRSHVHVAGTHPHAAGTYTNTAAAAWMAEAVKALRP